MLLLRSLIFLKDRNRHTIKSQDLLKKWEIGLRDFLLESSPNPDSVENNIIVILNYVRLITRP